MMNDETSLTRDDIYRLFRVDPVEDADAIRDVTAYYNEIQAYLKAKHDFMAETMTPWAKQWESDMEPTMMKIDDQEFHFKDYDQSTECTEYGFMVILTPCTETASEKLKQYTEHPRKQKVDLWFHTGCGENMYMGECVLEVEEKENEEGNNTYYFKFHDSP